MGTCRPWTPTPRPEVREHVCICLPATYLVWRLTADTANCPETATKLPGGGHENCPLTAMRSARHDSVCLAASRG
jgi:hypothetical protein